MKVEIDVMFWVLLGAIIGLSVIDWLVPQMPAASITEAVYESVQIITTIILGMYKVYKHK